MFGVYEDFTNLKKEIIDLNSDDFDNVSLISSIEKDDMQIKAICIDGGGIRGII